MVRKILYVAPFLFALVLVRVFENDLFYDPFLQYFHTSLYHDQLNFPEFSWMKMHLSLLFRYVLNALISLSILYVLFLDKKTLKFALVLYLIQYVLLGVVYSIMLANEFEWGYLSAFYVRRFLIQPILLILLVPALYYQNTKSL